MSRQLPETLKALLVERKKETLRKGWGEMPEWVFISETGTPLRPANFRDRRGNKAVVDRLDGLENTTIHNRLY